MSCQNLSPSVHQKNSDAMFVPDDFQFGQFENHTVKTINLHTKRQ